jgi:hypothetical protein
VAGFVVPVLQVIPNAYAMNARKPDTEEIHLSRNNLTFLSAIIGGLIIFSAYQYKQTPVDTSPAQTTPILQATEQPTPLAPDTSQADQVVAQNTPPSSVVKDLPTLVKEWSPRVVRIGCSDANYVSSGTGVLTQVNFSSIGKSAAPTLITNKHVVTDSDTGYLYTSCSFQTPDSEKVFPISMSIEQQSSTYDVAYFPSSTTNPPPGARTGLKVCSPTDAVVGDQIAVLGYPASGGTGAASTAITVTQGVVSSFDGDYYVTDAKIDHGNSGGAAILVKNDCYLGIPTWVESGGFESFGRILSAQHVLTPN